MPNNNQIMRDPVIASDGHTYERLTITQQVETKSISPLTCDPITSTFFPNILIQKLIENVETTNRDIYMERYQYDFKSFLRHYVSKYTTITKRIDREFYTELLNFDAIFNPEPYINNNSNIYFILIFN